MKSKDIIEQWKKDEAAIFKGWDFSYIKDRIIEEEPPWDYKNLAKKLVEKSSVVLDVATGGGEIFSSFAPFSKRAVAIEGYMPNVAVAKKRLEPLGVEVLEANEVDILPFADEEFDLVLNRHGGLRLQEIFRVLKRGGFFLTQQVGGDNLFDLLTEFGAKPKWQDNVLSVVQKKMTDIGFEILRSEEWKGKIIFKDVGAVVYFLKAIPWAVDNFSVDTHLIYLEKLQEKLEQKGRLEFTYARFFIFAKKK
ncbi:MAG: class I SAM-dependent methyltransferase [Patescibacteria group bacterium]|nr:class I SAM-dependent methyltransferase [Patescibacteria group bacterium]